MKILGNRFLAERVKNERLHSAGGIYLPPIVLDDNNTGGPKEWRVIAVGPGRRNRDGTTVPVEFGPGDRVIFRSFTSGATEAAPGQFILEVEGVIAILPK